jgi:NADH-quinone oxidoreductase subunit N
MSAVIMAIFMLGLAGVPPFSLFWGKMYLLGAAINADYIILALIMALNSGIAIYYYLKLIVYMFLKEPTGDNNVKLMGNTNNTLRTVVGITVVITLMSILMIEPLIQLVSSYVLVSGY